MELAVNHRTRSHDQQSKAAAYLDEKPRGDQSQAAVLSVEAVVVGIEGKMVQVEEPGKKGDSEDEGAPRDPTCVSTLGRGTA